jgi:hypothetical protein
MAYVPPKFKDADGTFVPSYIPDPPLQKSPRTKAGLLKNG